MDRSNHLQANLLTDMATLRRRHLQQAPAALMAAVLLLLLLLLLPTADAFGFKFGGDKGGNKGTEEDGNPPRAKAPTIPTGPPPQVEVLTGACAVYRIGWRRGGDRESGPP